MQQIRDRVKQATCIGSHTVKNIFYKGHRIGQQAIKVKPLYQAVQSACHTIQRFTNKSLCIQFANQRVDKRLLKQQ